MDIFLIDDDQDHRTLIKQRLGKIFKRCSVNDFSDAVTCLKFLESKNHYPDMIISDLFLENTMDGIDLFRELQKRKIPSQFILVSSNGNALADMRKELRNSDLCLPKEQFIKGNIDILRDKITRKRTF